MRLDQPAVRLANQTCGRALGFQPLSEIVTIAWPDGPTDHRAGEIGWSLDAAIRLDVAKHGPSYNLPGRRWAVTHHGGRGHSGRWRCHDGLHWYVGDAADAATTRQIWADRHRINQLLHTTRPHRTDGPPAWYATATRCSTGCAPPTSTSRLPVSRWNGTRTR
jgi:hypothetical protein